MGAIRKAAAAARARTDEPTLIRFKAIIGYGPPNTANSHDTHGLPIIVCTFGIMGDGCPQEGISHESGANSGHFGLGKLISVWDDNGSTIGGRTMFSPTEDVTRRGEAYSWQVLAVQDGN